MTSLAVHSKRHKVTVVGSGNWGSTIAKIVAENVKEHKDIFEDTVQMWVREEQVAYPEGSSKLHNLTDIINNEHQNVKYLPEITLPTNLIANPSLGDAVKNSTILIFNLPHQFIKSVCDQLKQSGNMVPFARGISCIKGVEVSDRGVNLLSDTIGKSLGIYCGALSGANIADEIAKEKWSETTIAYNPPMEDSKHPTPSASPTQSTTKLSSSVKSPLHALPSEYPPCNHENIKRLFHRPYFHVSMVSDVAGVSLGGALKNIIALAAGFVDGLKWGDNAKAAVMRVGILEQVKFGRMFFADSCEKSTFTQESCGVADVITSCMSGRNFRSARDSILYNMTIQEVEDKELNGQKLQGTTTAREVNAFLKSKDQEAEFPLFTAVYNILEGNAKPADIPSLIEEKSKL